MELLVGDALKRPRRLLLQSFLIMGTLDKTGKSFQGHQSLRNCRRSLNSIGATRVMTMDIHAGQIQGYFDIPVDNLHAAPILIDYIKANLFDLETVLFHRMQVAWSVLLAKKLKADIAMVDKGAGKNVAKALMWWVALWQKMYYCR